MNTKPEAKRYSGNNQPNVKRIKKVGQEPGDKLVPGIFASYGMDRSSGVLALATFHTHFDCEDLRLRPILQGT